MKTVLITAALLAAALLLTGCDNPTADHAAEKGAVVRPTAASDADGIELVPISYKEWTQKLAGYPPEIVVVDMWATWCAPCIERFPKMVELHKKYGDRGVRFVSMNLDSREDKPALKMAEQFLINTGASFENYLMNENLLEAFEMLDLLGIPTVLVYGPDGQERFRLTGDNPNSQFTDRDIESAIETLLAQR
ncbi:MAG TPA: TlpA disulfide reductase family protein [Gammaproteobacteria bacterium]